MTLTNLEKTPWPWFGGKADAAPLIWDALGDVDHYVEPFYGSGAVHQRRPRHHALFLRPHEANRTYHSETVNDADGMLCNAWRSIQWSPDATADAASWPVCEADLHARHLALLRWREERQLEHLMGDPKWHDPVMAGWWLWGMSCWIGSGWCSGRGPWIVGADGRITKRERGAGGGVHKKLPHLGDDGQGVNRPQAREPGVSRQRPHLGDDGRGVNRPQAREEGVSLDPRDDDAPDFGFHPMTMPEVRRWFAFLSARLRHVRILNGDWKRALTGGASKTLSVRIGDGFTGIFLDPPYAVGERDADLYTHDAAGVAEEVRAWCVANGSDPKLRIVLAGYAGEGHEELERLGWRCVSWFSKGFLKGGMGVQSEDGHQQDRERLWCSPACLGGEKAVAPRQGSLFAALEVPR